MNERPTVSLVGVSRVREEGLRAVLGEHAELRREADAATACAAARAGRAMLAIVDLGDDADRGLRSLTELRFGGGEVRVMALAPHKDPELILRSLRAGAREYLVLEDPAELQRRFAAVAGDPRVRRPTGSVLAVLPARGGAGATMVATNLAAALAAGGRRTVLVDLDRQLGDVATFLDVAAACPMSELLANQHRLDGDLLVSWLTRHRSGLHVLASDRFDDGEGLTPEAVTRLLQLLASHYEYVVCDGLRGVRDVTRAALHAASRVVLVAQQDFPSLRSARRVILLLGRLGLVDGEKLCVVVNRYRKREPDLGAIGERLGVAPAEVLADEYKVVRRAVDLGQLLSEAAPRASVTAGIARLAERLSGTSPRPGLLRSLFRRPAAPAPAVVPERTA